MGIRVGGRVGPVWISVGVGTLLLAVCCVAAPVVGTISDTADEIRNGAINWGAVAAAGVGVILLAAFIAFAFWFNSPRQVQRRQERRRKG